MAICGHKKINHGNFPCKLDVTLIESQVHFNDFTCVQNLAVFATFMFSKYFNLVIFEGFDKCKTKNLSLLNKRIISWLKLQGRQRN